VLSGAIVKAGIIGLLRFLPTDGTLADWGPVLAALGLLTAFWGVGCGITQDNPKTVLAYSTVSQMGVAAAALGMGMALAEPATPMAVAFYAAHHVLAKGALFLAVGLASVIGGRRGLWLVLLPALVLALGFGGLPPTGGALAKAAVKAQLGADLVGVLSALSAAASTMLMLHFVRRLAAGAAGVDPAARPPALLLLPWLGLAAAAILLPWALYGASGFGDPLYLLGAGLPAALWPVLLGTVLALALRRWGDRLGRVPEGDVLLLASRGKRAAGVWSGAVARTEAVLRAWPVAGLAMLALVLAFGAAMLAAVP
jgi:formate hydrogenlyase subunit 3/multisubunit Na+/H+ antiporter MnhD subunit